MYWPFILIKLYLAKYAGKCNKFLRQKLQKYTLHCQPTGVKLGRGTWSTVVELELTDAKHKKRVAGKVFKPPKLMEMKEDGLKTFIREIEMVIGLQHDHVVACKGVYFLPDTQLPILVMEQLMGSLYAHLKDDPFSVTEDKKQLILADVASGLDYLHSCTPAIIHQDLTPKNVLLWSEDLRAKISDCCDARIMSVAVHKDYINTNDPIVDVKSFGLLALFTIMGREVHPPKSKEHISYRLKSDNEDELLREAKEIHHGSSLLELIRQCLGPAEKRFKPAELRDKLMHMQTAPSGTHYIILMLLCL